MVERTDLEATPPTSGLGRSVLHDSEMTTAFLRVTAGTAMVVLYFTGGLPDSTGWAAEALLLAAGYALLVFSLVGRLFVAGDEYPPKLTMTLTILDNAIIIVLSMLTGGLGSLIVAILLLVITTNAARYGVQRAVWCALADAVALFALCFVVDEPADLLARIRLAGWWSWLLIGGAVIAGITARAALEYRTQLLTATHEAEVERFERTLADQARQELEIAAEGRRDFLRVMTHELRTPIASIGALSRALSSQGRSDMNAEQRAEALDLMRSHAEHLHDLLASVRELSRDALEQSTPVVLSDIALDEIVRSSASAAGLPRDRLHLGIPDPLRHIRSDREKLRRILTNLLENAGRHSREAVAVRAHRDGPHLHLQVLDRGTGLSPEVAERVFDKGFTFGGARDSSGLGLWIVREMTDSLGGSVWAEPRDGGGLTVHVRVPYSAAKGDAPQPNSPMPDRPEVANPA